MLLSKEHKEKIRISLLGNKRACKFGKTILTPEYKREWSRKHYAKNIKRLREYRRVQRHNSRTQGGRLTVKLMQIVYEDNIKKYGTLTCYLCLKSIEFKQDSIDHKIPLSRGGTNEYKNLAITHLSCNKKKHTKTEMEYKGGL